MADDRVRFEIPLNDQSLHFDDRKIEGREALNAGGLRPASEFQLILVHDGRTHLIEAEDKIDLAESQGAHLRAFQSDRIFAFTVDEVSQVWGDVDIEVDEFETIWTAPEGSLWILERSDEPDVALAPGGVLSFGESGVEHVVSRPVHGSDKIVVTVVTTSGTYPAEGGVRVATSELVSTVLAEAAKKLKLTDTTGWVTTVNNADINPELTFAQNHLLGTITINWGAREGGGGHA